MLPGALLAFPSTVASFCCRPRLLLLLLLLLPELGVDGWWWEMGDMGSAVFSG